MILTNALLLTAAGLVFVRAFLGKEGRYPHTPHEVSLPMWIGPMLLAVGGFVFGAFNNLAEVWLIDAAVQAVSRATVPVSLYLWGGFTPALVASLLTVALGVFFYLQRTRLRRRLSLWRVLWRVSGDRIWDRLLKRVFAFATRVADRFQHGSLRQHISALVLAIAGFALIGLFASTGEDFAWPEVTSPINLAALLGCVLAVAVAGAAAAAVTPGRVALVATLGASGLGMAMFFLAARAPDVAITQLMVETLTVIFLALVLRRLPPTRLVGSRKPAAKRFHAVVAVVIGAVVAAMMLMTVSQPLPGDIARWYLDNSLPGGQGANVVNVILVDFRGFDTFGEITVFGIAALIVHALLRRARMAPEKVMSGPPIKLPVPADLAQIMFPLTLTVSVFLFLRGHNAPGGGFIAGLVLAVPLLVQYVIQGAASVESRFGFDYVRCVGAGLIVAGVSGVASMAFGVPFLTSGHLDLELPLIGTVPLASAIGFDTGVYLVVFGGAMLILSMMGTIRPSRTRVSHLGVMEPGERSTRTGELR